MSGLAAVAARAAPSGQPSVGQSSHLFQVESGIVRIVYAQATTSENIYRILFGQLYADASLAYRYTGPNNIPDTVPVVVGEWKAVDVRYVQRSSSRYNGRHVVVLSGSPGDSAHLLQIDPVDWFVAFDLESFPLDWAGAVPSNTEDGFLMRGTPVRQRPKGLLRRVAAKLVRSR